MAAAVGGPGQVGLVRLDGLDECSQRPSLEENGDPITPYDDYTYFGPTVGSLGTAQVLDLEQRVTRSRTLALQIGGAGPLHRDSSPSPEPFDIDIVNDSGVFDAVHDVLANFRGTRTELVTVRPGFTSVYLP